MLKHEALALQAMVGFRCGSDVDQVAMNFESVISGMRTETKHEFKIDGCWNPIYYVYIIV